MYERLVIFLSYYTKKYQGSITSNIGQYLIEQTMHYELVRAL